MQPKFQQPLAVSQSSSPTASSVRRHPPAPPPSPRSLGGPRFNSTIVTAVTTGPSVAPQPYVTSCPSCRTEIMTRVEYMITTKTHIIALLLCFLCFPLGVVPYIIDGCKNANHYCPNCGCYIGTYFR